MTTIKKATAGISTRRAKEGGMVAIEAGRGDGPGWPHPFSPQTGSVLAAYLRANRQKLKTLFQNAGIPPADVECFFWSVVEGIEDAEWKETADPGALLLERLTGRVEDELAAKQLWTGLTQMISVCAPLATERAKREGTEDTKC